MMRSAELLNEIGLSGGLDQTAVCRDGEHEQALGAHLIGVGSNPIACDVPGSSGNLAPSCAALLALTG